MVLASVSIILLIDPRAGSRTKKGRCSSETVLQHDLPNKKGTRIQAVNVEQSDNKNTGVDTTRIVRICRCAGHEFCASDRSGN